MENKINKFLEELIQEIENDLDEATTSGAAGAYSTPNAFSDNGSKDKKKKKKIATQLGMKLVGKVNEASIKGKNNKTGESFGMVIGSDKKNREGDFEVTIRKTYSSRITSYKFIFDNSSNLIEIADYGYSMDGKFPDMKGSASVKSVKPNPRETITQIAKVTSPAFAKKIVQHVKKVNESVNEGKYNYKADALTAYFKGKIDAKELDKIARDDFKSGIATKKELSNFLSNKFTQDVMSDTYGIPSGTLIKRVRGLMKFAEGKESVNEAMKPSQVRSTISKVKKGLMRKWKQKGGYENFGQKELDKMKSKFDYNPYGSPDERQISKMLDGFDNWAMNYDGNMREDISEAKVKRPVNRWLAIKNDETKHPHKKMAMGLKELKHQLAETQKFFNWYNKIKTMNELDSNQYWKRTNKHIYKIKERLVNIAKTIQEIEK